MNDLTPELRERFVAFREAYEAARTRMEEYGASGLLIASHVWDAALQVVPLDRDELRLYRQLVALHSVNGGELFADPDRKESP